LSVRLILLLKGRNAVDDSRAARLRAC
jgi:hypothetical protein